MRSKLHKWRSVLVHGKKHKIVWNPRKMPEDRWGDYDVNTWVIRIGKAPIDQQREILLHELLHAIEDRYDCELDHDKLEKISRGIFALMRENPGLAEDLFGDDE